MFVRFDSDINIFLSLLQHNFFKRTTDEATNTSKSANASPANISPQLHSSIPVALSSSTTTNKGLSYSLVTP